LTLGKSTWFDMMSKIRLKVLQRRPKLA